MTSRSTGINYWSGFRREGMLDFLQTLLTAWKTFFFAPEPVTTLVLFRIFVGCSVWSMRYAIF